MPVLNFDLKRISARVVIITYFIFFFLVKSWGQGSDSCLDDPDYLRSPAAERIRPNLHPKIFINLMVNLSNSNGTVDGVAACFSNKYAAAVDSNDAKEAIVYCDIYRWCAME